jgi:hypothetical protein
MPAGIQTHDWWSTNASTSATITSSASMMPFCTNCDAT